MTGPVAAVVAAFEPDGELLEVVEQALAQCDSVIVVDDGSPSRSTGATAAVGAVLAACAAAGARVIEQPENAGIASALNAGIREARRLGARYVLTLDQDTHIESGYVTKALNHLALAGSVGADAAMVSPSLINDDVAPFWFADKGLTLAFEPIQSGLLIPCTVFDTIGLFEEDLFIDCVETEFYLRARAHGMQALVVPGTRIRHRLGRTASWVPPWPLRPILLRGRGPGATIEFTEHPPFRNYYISRNRLVLYRRYARAEPLWCAVSVAKDTLIRGRAMLIGTQRPARIRLSVAGVRAALAGDTGKIPDGLVRGRGHPRSVGGSA